MMPTDWIPHRRPSDAELVGYLVLSDDGTQPINLLGQPMAEPIEYDEAEALLEDRGLALLADRWLLSLPNGDELPVVIVQLDSTTVVLSGAISGAIEEIGVTHELTLPVGDRLRPAA